MTEYSETVLEVADRVTTAPGVGPRPQDRRNENDDPGDRENPEKQFRQDSFAPLVSTTLLPGATKPVDPDFGSLVPSRGCESNPTP